MTSDLSSALEVCFKRDALNKSMFTLLYSYLTLLLTEFGNNYWGNEFANSEPPRFTVLVNFSQTFVTLFKVYGFLCQFQWNWSSDFVDITILYFLGCRLAAILYCQSPLTLTADELQDSRYITVPKFHQNRLSSCGDITNFRLLDAGWPQSWIFEFWQRPEGRDIRLC